MGRTRPADGMGTGSAAQLGVDRRTSPADMRDIRAALDALAATLRARWWSALERGDFDEITRLVEASQAVHRAVVALTADSLGPCRGSARAHWN
jgi:hypothetical protein